MIALTFEAGGDPQPATVIVTLLREAHVRATFFLDGKWAEANPELVRQMHADGHELGNHGYAHADWTELSDEEIAADLAATEAVVLPLAGRRPQPWARPPYGAIDQRVLDVLKRAGYRALYRDAVDGGHWPGETNPDSIYAQVLANATDGAVIVFHTDRQDTASALPSILADLAASRFELVPLSELGSIPAPRLEIHPDFAALEIRPGYIRPKVAGRWRSLNLLELGAALKRTPNRPEPVAEANGAALDLILGVPSEPFDCPAAESDRHLLVLAGEVTCRFAHSTGEEMGTVLARCGDLVLWPSGAAARLTCARRWTGTLLHNT